MKHHREWMAKPLDITAANLPMAPERRLWAAVMLQAIEDMTIVHPRLYGHSARQWIRRRGDARFNSFTNVCRIIGMDPDTARRRIMTGPGRTIARDAIGRRARRQ